MPQTYPPFQQPITQKAGQVDNPAWRLFFVQLWTAISGSVTHITGALTNSHLLLGNGGGDIRALGSLGSTTTVLHGNAAGDPTFAAVSLTTDVTGTLPIARGGTNSATALSGSTIMISNGTAIVQGAAGTTTTVLHGNAGGPPTYAAVSMTADVTGTLPVSNGGTGLASLTTNRIPYGNGNSPFQESASFTFDGTTLVIPGQIQFPGTQLSSSNVNTLDDYEEGTWTPALTFGGGSTGLTYSANTGAYTKIGRVVVLTGLLLLSNKGSSAGAASIAGLPFAIDTGNAFYAGQSSYSANFAVTINTVSFRLDQATSVIVPYNIAAGGATAMVDTDFTNTSLLFMSAVYHAAT